MMAVYFAYVQPFQQYLTVKIKGSGRTDHIWANEYGPWGTDRLTKIIDRESSKRLGTRLSTLDTYAPNGSTLSHLFTDRKRYRVVP